VPVLPQGIDAIDYTGLDPSPAMLGRLRAKHPDRVGQTICTPLRSFVGGTYDLILALCGAASYLTEQELVRIPGLLKPGGHLVLMFHAPDARPLIPGAPIPERALEVGEPWHGYVVVAR
jgi:SAM-dependent methyltransferase